MSCESEESTHPVTPVGPLVGSVPRLLAVLVVLPASPAVPPSVWTALHGARPEVLVSILGPKASIVFAGCVGISNSSRSSFLSNSFSKLAEASGENIIINIRPARKILRLHIVLNICP